MSANVYRDTREMGERTPCIHTKANFEGEYVMSGSRYGASTHQELPKYDLLEARDLYKTQNPRDYVIKSRQRQMEATLSPYLKKTETHADVIDEEEIERQINESKDIVLKRRIERESNPKHSNIAFELSCVPLRR